MSREKRRTANGTQSLGLEPGMLGGQEAKGSRRMVQGKRKTEKPEHKEEEAGQSVSGLSARLRFQLRRGRLRTEPI